jgi:Universal stress protein family
VAIDFSNGARDALRQARLFLAEKPTRLIALHVIDRDFITDCIRHKLGDEGQIKKKALENNVDMIIIGICGKTGDMSQILFGSTAEKILRFITRPVLCIPSESDYRTA